MDDNRFDDILKNKVGEYEEPGFDPSALAGLHYRMATQYSAPWYVRYRNQMLTVAASVAVVLLLWWSQYRIGEAENTMLRKEISQLQEQKAELQDIQNKLSGLSKMPDTVHLVEYIDNNETLYRELLGQINDLKRELWLSQSSANKKLDLENGGQLFYLGSNEIVPKEVVERLQKDFEVLNKNGDVFLIARGDLESDQIPWSLSRKELLNKYTIPEYRFTFDSVYLNDLVKSEVIDQKIQISMKQMRELEKHYTKGIGLRLGPSIDIYSANYTGVANDQEGWGGGILADLIVSPSLSVETGFNFHRREYDTGVDGYNHLTLPEPDAFRGEFNALEITSFMFETPLNLKYRYTVSPRSSLTASVGVSGLLYTKQSIEYKYNFDVEPGLSLPVESVFREKDFNWHLGTINASVGLQHRLVNDKRLEASLYYKRGLDKLGIEQAEANFFGIRGVYWFTIKE